MKPIAFVDLGAQRRRIAGELDRRIAAVLAHGRFIMGAEVAELEAALADRADVRHAVTAASGTHALSMALMAHGVGPGDAVFTTPFTLRVWLRRLVRVVKRLRPVVSSGTSRAKLERPRFDHVAAGLNPGSAANAFQVVAMAEDVSAFVRWAYHA